MGDGQPKENPLELPKVGSPAVTESVAGGASGGSSVENLDLPPAVRRDSNTEGGVKGLPKDNGPSTSLSSN